MAMTKEELIDLIDNTINTNGEKTITGQALNLALKEIVDAMGSGDGGASMNLNISMSALSGGENDLTEEQLAENVELYNAIIAAKDTPASIAIYSKITMEGEVTYWGQCPYWLAGGMSADGQEQYIVCVVIGGGGEQTMPLQLLADGTVAMANTNSLSLAKLNL